MEKNRQFLSSIKKMHTRENWFLFSASRCTFVHRCKNVFTFFILVTFYVFNVFYYPNVFLFLINVGKVQSGKQNNKKHFQNNNNEIQWVHK